MLIRDHINPVSIIYSFPVLPARLAKPPGPDLELFLVEDPVYGDAALHLKHRAPHGTPLRRWPSKAKALFYCAHGIEFDYNPGPNYLRDLARAGLARVVVGPFCSLRYSDPTVVDRGYWPVPRWTGPEAWLYEGERGRLSGS